MTVAFNVAKAANGGTHFYDSATLSEKNDYNFLYILNDARNALAREMSVLVTKPQGVYSSDKLVFIHHGRNGNAEGMRDIASAYLERGYIVVAANARNSHFNTSAGAASDFTINEHIEDMDRTIQFALNHAGSIGWTGQQFALAGFSMGGYAASYLAATKYAQDTTHLLAMSPLTTGERQIEARRDHPKGIENLQRELPLAMSEWPQHDIYKHIDGLIAPASVIVGADDTVTPPRHVCAFADALKQHGKLVSVDVLKGRHHSVLNQQDNDFSALVFQRVGELEKTRTISPRPHAGHVAPSPF